MTAPAGLARLLVTGERGAGKTTFCRTLVAAVRARPGGPEAAGILSPRVYEVGEQVGIDAEDLRTGRRRRLATRREQGEPGSGEAAGHWDFDPGALAWADEVLRSATPCGLLVVDELGPLEFEEQGGWQAGLAAVDSGAFRAAVVVVRPRLLGTARRRWPEAGVLDAGEAAAAGVEVVARRLLPALFR